MSDQEKVTSKPPQLDHCQLSNVIDKTNGNDDDAALQSMMAAVKLDADIVDDGSPNFQHHHQNLESPLSAQLNGCEYSFDYLSALLCDRERIYELPPNSYQHVARILDQEIEKVRTSLFQFDLKSPDEPSMPPPEGEVVSLQEHINVPVDQHPDYNFVGRILGPRGMTAKRLEQVTGCRIMVRGRGSMRDKQKEEQNRGKPNWEHLAEDLHILLQCDDTPNRAKIKLQNAVAEVQKLLVPPPEGEDDLKRKQLMELAIINGTYRASTMRHTQTPRMRRILFPTPTSSPSNICWSSSPSGYPIGANIHQPTMNAAAMLSSPSPSSAGYYSNSSYSPSGYAAYTTTPNTYAPPPPYFVNSAGAQLFCNNCY